MVVVELLKSPKGGLQMTRIVDDVSVWHYCHTRRFDCKNQIVRVLQRMETHPAKQAGKAKPQFVTSLAHQEW